MKAITIFVLLSLIHHAFGGLGVDVSTDIYIDHLKCFKANGYNFISARCYESNGHVDSNAIHTIYNARDAGFSDANIQVYMFPCPRCGNADAQVKAAVDNLNNAKAPFSKFWLDIEDTSSHAYWGSDTSANRNFMISLLNAAIKYAGKDKVGIYASVYMWQLVFGSDSWDCCRHYDLWYADYDGRPNFDGFRSFGGWTSAAAKQYKGTTNLCGASVDLDYSPRWTLENQTSW